MMAAPYRLQVLLPDDLREVLREVAHRQRISQQKLVVRWLTEKARETPEGATLPLPDEES